MKRFIYIFTALFLFMSCTSSGEQQDIQEQNTDKAILTGTVIEVIENGKTLSEYRYFELRSDAGKMIIFNEKGYSAGFQDWANKMVAIEYEPYTGTIGFRRKKAQGILVKSIEPAP